MNKLNIIIADDHELTLNGIVEQIKLRACNTNIYKALSGEEALKIFNENNIDMLITDVNMPKMNGIELIEKVKSKKKDTKIIVITYLEQHSIFEQLGKLKVDAVVLKTDSTKTLSKAFETVCNGGKFISPELLDIFAEKRDNPQNSLTVNLTGRENEILILLSEDLSTKEIADKISVSTATVDTYRKSLKKKLKAKTIPGLITKAHKYGIL